MKNTSIRSRMFIVLTCSVLMAVSCELFTEEVVRENELIGTWSFDDASAQVYVGNVNITQLLIVTYGYTSDEAEIKLDSLLDEHLEEMGKTLTLNEDNTYLIDGEGDDDASGTWEFDPQKDALRLTESGALVAEKYTIEDLRQTTMVMVLPNRFEVLDLDGDGEQETNCTIVAEIQMVKIQPVN